MGKSHASQYANFGSLRNFAPKNSYSEYGHTNSESLALIL